MKATYWQPGAKIDFANATENKIEANTVVTLGSRIGVVGTDIEPGAVGSVITEGVFILDKTSSSTVVALGDALYFDGTGITKDASATVDEETVNNTPAGWAIKASASGDATVYVKIG